MVIENNLTKKVYRRLLLRNLFFESKTSLIILLLYIMLWRVLYTITKIGQLKTNVPIFLGISLLLLLTFIYVFVVYRKYMKNDYIFQDSSRIEINQTELVIVSSNATDSQALPLKSLIKIKENKKWYFLYFKDQTFIPISKETEHSLIQVFKTIKPIHPIFWKWTISFFSLVTILGAYYVGSNAVNFNGALAWKIYDLKTEKSIKLENDNFYSTKLDGIIDSVKAKMKLEPHLMTNDVEIEFKKDGTITDLYLFIYGFDQNEKLQSSYLIYMEKAKGNRLKVHKQDWHGEGTTVYDPNNDLSIVINMLNRIPVKEEVKRWNEEKNAVLYKGIRTWSSLEGIHLLDEKGNTYIPSITDTVISGPTISVYIPGKENIITPQRYVNKPFFSEE